MVIRNWVKNITDSAVKSFRQLLGLENLLGDQVHEKCERKWIIKDELAGTEMTQSPNKRAHFICHMKYDHLCEKTCDNIFWRIIVTKVGEAAFEYMTVPYRRYMKYDKVWRSR